MAPFNIGGAKDATLHRLLFRRSAVPGLSERAHFLLSQLAEKDGQMIAENILVWAALLGVITFLAVHSARQ